MIRLASVLATVLLIAFSSLHRWKPAPKTEATADSARATAEKLAALRAEIATLASKAAQEQAQDVAATRVEVRSLLARFSGEAEACAQQAARPFQGFGNVSNCIYMGGKDQVFGGHRLPDYISASMQPATDLLHDAERQVGNQLEALRQRSLARANRFISRTLSATAAARLEPAALGCSPAEVGKLAGQANQVCSHEITAALTLAMEAIFLKANYAAIRQVVERLIEREAASLTAAGVAALADGPLPIGEIIGACVVVGGAAWTAWDVRKAVTTYRALPGQIHTSLLGLLNSLGHQADQSLDAFTPAFAPVYAVTK